MPEGVFESGLQAVHFNMAGHQHKEKKTPTVISVFSLLSQSEFPMLSFTERKSNMSSKKTKKKKKTRDTTSAKIMLFKQILPDQRRLFCS